MSTPTVLMTGGGTGGHVFPLLAVAEALRRRLPEIDLVFVGTPRGIETRLIPQYGYKLELLSSLPVRGDRVLGVARGLFRAAANVPEALALIRRYQPALVFSLGGYAAAAVCTAARWLRLPVALMEPNSVVGLSNRALAPFVQRAYTTFEAATNSFKAKIVRQTGLALRSGFGPRPYQRLPTEPLRVLVLGGSQGARALNELVPLALSRSRTSIQVLHQSGHHRQAELAATYARLGAGGSSRVVPFIDDMPEALGQAQLVISRAGAGAIAEIAAVGRPSILVPYPYAAGDHQRMNALELQRAGAAICLPEREATTPRLAALIDELAADPRRASELAEKATAWGRPDAADVVAVDLLSLANLAAPAGSPRVSGIEPLGFLERGRPSAGSKS